MQRSLRVGPCERFLGQVVDVDRQPLAGQVRGWNVACADGHDDHRVVGGVGNAQTQALLPAVRAIDGADEVDLPAFQRAEGLFARGVSQHFRLHPQVVRDDRHVVGRQAFVAFAIGDVERRNVRCVHTQRQYPLAGQPTPVVAVERDLDVGNGSLADQGQLLACLRGRPCQQSPCQ
ncbi:Uncharacterised protein [Bordetella pertussis]|nr:Uncharacterised protein [Bordetella pertussis]